MRSDTELLDALQGLLDNVGVGERKVICRWSAYSRGWRLHETTRDEGVTSVRESINHFLTHETGLGNE